MLTTNTPITQAVVVTPSDTTDISAPNDRSVSRGFMVNVTGSVSVNMQGSGSAVVLTATAGIFYPYSVKRVLATGTTATGITAFF